ncbi:MAG: PAS domain S-box protein [Deltaproteobacteria bacterium]|nr:PAS domain S-box protein [Deltaproteobacteria bacterium]
MKAHEDMYSLKGRLQLLMLFRVLVAAFFLGIATVTQLRRSDSFLTPHLIYLYSLTGTAFGLTFIYVFVLSFLRRFVFFAYVQIIVDLFLITMLLFITGGINSIFAFLYSVEIIAASICLFISGGLFAATAASILFPLLITLEHYHVISPFHIGAITATGYERESLFFPIVINVAAFYLVAVLSSFLTEQARKSRQQLQKKQVDLAQLEALNEKIIENMPSGLVTLNQFQQIITFNRAAEEITGYRFAQTYMKGIEDIFPGIATAVSSHSLLSPGSSLTAGFEMAFLRRDGRSRWLGFSGARLKDVSNDEIGTILIFQDLTDFREMQEHLKRIDRLAAVGRLAAGIAHEVRNPLASISGSIQVLQKSLQLDTADKRLMDIIVRESENLSSLISDFTLYARAEAPGHERVVLYTVADEVIDLFKNSTECSPGIAIRQLIPRQITITANRQQIKQVLWNLILNAAQAMTDKSGSITLTAAAVEHGFEPAALKSGSLAPAAGAPAAAWVVLKIADEGCGIKRSEINSIFDPFFTTKDAGSGLGLSIVYKIIQEHKGAIDVESEEGKGAVFSVFFPV